MQVLQEHGGTIDGHLHWVWFCQDDVCHVCLMLPCGEHLEPQQVKRHTSSWCQRCPEVLGGEDLRI